MAKVKKELADILARYDLDPKDALWDCHGTLVIYHKHCELIAAKAGITFDPPQIIEAKSGEKVVAICAVGRMGERSEWSIGEAAPGNNKNAYPYAMAEKRAKDRVILKLAGLSAYIYSEDEADDFKEKPKAPVEDAPKPGAPANLNPAIVEFFNRASYEMPGDDLLAIADKVVKASGHAWHPDQLLKLEEDNKDHISALNNQAPASWKEVQTALTAARKRLVGLAA